MQMARIFVSVVTCLIFTVGCKARAGSDQLKRIDLVPGWVFEVVDVGPPRHRITLDLEGNQVILGGKAQSYNFSRLRSAPPYG